jgi:hypothetical protein
MPFPESHPNNCNFITETPDDQEMQTVENSGARRIALYPDAIVGAWGKLRGYKPGVGAGVRYA